MAGRLHDTFCENLRAALREKGMTQRQLAMALGTTEAHISQLLSGRTVPRLGVIEQIAQSLDVEPHTLLIPAREKVLA